MFTLSVLTVFGTLGLIVYGAFKLVEQLAAGPQNNF